MPALIPTAPVPQFGAPAEVVPSDSLIAALEAAERYVDMAMSKSTFKAYKSDFAHFHNWCLAQRLPSLPAKPSTVALYLASMAETRKISTIVRRLAAIAMLHRDRKSVV